MRGLCLSLAAGLAAACSPQPAPYDALWTEFETGASTGLRGLSVVDAETIWAGGDNAVALRSTNGGLSWTVIEVDAAAGAALRSVHAFSAEHALYLTAGTPARVLETRDGGDSFSIVYEDPEADAFYDSVVFWDERRGIAFSDPVAGAFRILLTENGGANWRHVPPANLPPPLEGEAGFAASGQMIAVRPDGHAWIGTGGAAQARILVTDDFGESWNVFDTPLRAGAPGRGVFGLARASGRLVAVGGDYTAENETDAVLALSDDGGASWRTPESGPSGYRESVAPLPGTDGRIWLTVGPNGADLSLDAGENWSRVSETGYHALEFTPDGRFGYLVGSDGRAGRVTLLPR